MFKSRIGLVFAFIIIYVYKFSLANRSQKYGATFYVIEYKIKGCPGDNINTNIEILNR